MPVDPEEIDRLLVEELNQLSFKYRERVLEEVHGVSATDPIARGDALEEALRLMQDELDRHYYSFCTGHDIDGSHDDANGSHSDESKAHLNCSSSSSVKCLYGAYQDARSQNSEMLVDIELRRGFLVAENWNPKKAALRMMKYLERMQELYETSDVLFRPIFIDDLHIDAREQLVMGSYQILPERDSSGRRIFVYLRDICPSTVSNTLRSQVFMYFAQKLVEDRDGMVCVLFLHNSTLFTGIEDKGLLYEQSRMLIECMPSRYHAIHICMPDKQFYRLVKSAIMLVIGKENRIRVRIHVGSHVECRYSLSTFGIPTSRLPMALDLNTTLRKDNISYHTKWLRMQRAKEVAIGKIHSDIFRKPAGSPEQQSEALNSGNPTVVGMAAVNMFRAKFVECPRHEDCLFGRGRNTMKHPGNVAMRAMLEGKRDRYACAAHQKKSAIAWEVVNEIKNGGGRFLRELDTGLFTLVDDEMARKKISIAFRDLKNKPGKRAHQKNPEKQANWEEGKPKRHKFCSEQNYHSGASTSGDSETECFRQCF